ncbi:hypothetical protein AB0H29_01610 [Streptomyces thermolilacinus]
MRSPSPGPRGSSRPCGAHVGGRGFSAYVSTAVERRLRRDLPEELLREKEAAIGPAAPEGDAWAEDVFRSAEAQAARSGGRDERPWG